ncbi:MAG: thiopurine S-methyltransferase [Robiginitomaculum sp.]|nr:thiopurine S-methyltransferase [Robiginitomaculum sp.]
MENPQFWHNKWQSGELGFHLEDTNAALAKYWPGLDIDGACEVLVPLCGKSLDMLWLRQQGHTVLGVELSPIAAKEFFAENKIAYETTKRGKFQSFSGDGFTILVGDIFDLTKTETANVKAVYDRAALIALPPAMQEKYVAHIKSILAPKTQILLVTLEYDPSEMDGPPFSTKAPEVQAHFASWSQIKMLKTTALTDFRDIAANETVYKLVVA